MLADAIVASYNAFLNEGINPMLSTLQKQDADAYYQLLESRLTPLNSAFTQSVDAFKNYANEVTEAQLAQAAKNETLLTMLILFCGILTVILLTLSGLCCAPSS